MPDIYLLIDGQQHGPYTEEQVKQSLAEGHIPADLPAWYDGLEDWVQVESLVRPFERQSATEMKQVIAEENVSADSGQVLVSSYSQSAQRGSRRQRGLHKNLKLMASLLAGMLVIGFSVGLGLWMFRPHTEQTNSEKEQVVVARPYVPPAASTTNSVIQAKPSDVTSGSVSYHAKNAADVAEWFFEDDKHLESPFNSEDVTRSENLLPGSSKTVAENMLMPGIDTPVSEVDDRLDSFLLNEHIGIKSPQMQIRSLKSPFPFQAEIRYDDQAPNVAVYLLGTDKYYYRIGIVFLATADDEDKAVNRLKSMILATTLIVGDDTIATKMSDWWKALMADSSASKVFVEDTNGKKVFTTLVPLPNRSPADIMVLTVIGKQSGIIVSRDQVRGGHGLFSIVGHPLTSSISGQPGWGGWPGFPG